MIPGHDLSLPSEYIYVNTLSLIAEVAFCSGDISFKKVFLPHLLFSPAVPVLLATLWLPRLAYR